MNSKQSQDLQSVLKEVEKMPLSFLRWCEADICACLGCVNHKFLSKGFTKKHFEDFMEERDG